MVASGKWGREKPVTGKLVRGQTPSENTQHAKVGQKREDEVGSRIILELGKTRLKEKLRPGPTTA